MTKAPPKHPRQLEIPILANLNNKVHVVHIPPKPHRKTSHIDAATDEEISLRATTDDLTIYRSISESFLKRIR
ncbi:MAG: hypothetical protein KJ852_11355 [Gammaproteobacteria bacterium]|nr:hypothetical protein [Gammaproteobacteria bacterium]MBU0787265.1 hypothetical protein [Gammaproteobacteria bacterium]MBU0816005.1 hypothetical protein [Gammaproteobacteria bacterium]MBU1787544.1 hypothetical protein [Gammaproteobacteria bacterium]